MLCVYSLDVGGLFWQVIQLQLLSPQNHSAHQATSPWRLRWRGCWKMPTKSWAPDRSRWRRRRARRPVATCTTTAPWATSWELHCCKMETSYMASKGISCENSWLVGCTGLQLYLHCGHWRIVGAIRQLSTPLKILTVDQTLSFCVQKRGFSHRDKCLFLKKSQRWTQESRKH